MKLTSDGLAQKLGISSRFMRHIEFGDRFSSVYNFRKIINILDLDNSTLIDFLLKVNPPKENLENFKYIRYNHMIR